MAKILEVYWAEKLVGQLIQDDHGELNFSYAASWLIDADAIPISCSLPLQKINNNVAQKIATMIEAQCKRVLRGV